MQSSDKTLTRALQLENRLSSLIDMTEKAEAMVRTRRNEALTKLEESYVELAKRRGAMTTQIRAAAGVKSKSLDRLKCSLVARKIELESVMANCQQLQRANNLEKESQVRYKLDRFLLSSDLDFESELANINLWSHLEFYSQNVSLGRVETGFIDESSLRFRHQPEDTVALESGGRVILDVLFSTHPVPASMSDYDWLLAVKQQAANSLSLRVESKCQEVVEFVFFKFTKVVPDGFQASFFGQVKALGVHKVFILVDDEPIVETPIHLKFGDATVDSMELGIVSIENGVATPVNGEYKVPGIFRKYGPRVFKGRAKFFDQSPTEKIKEESFSISQAQNTTSQKLDNLFENGLNETDSRLGNSDSSSKSTVIGLEAEHEELQIEKSHSPGYDNKCEATPDKFMPFRQQISGICIKKDKSSNNPKDVNGVNDLLQKPSNLTTRSNGSIFKEQRLENDRTQCDGEATEINEKLPLFARKENGVEDKKNNTNRSQHSSSEGRIVSDALKTYLQRFLKHQNKDSVRNINPSSLEVSSGIKNENLNLSELFRGKREIIATRRGTVGQTGAGKLDYPIGICVDDEPDGTENLYVCDSKCHRVVVYSKSGQYIRYIGKRCLDKSSWKPEEFHRPSGVVCTGRFVFVKDLYRIQKFDREGNFLLSFGAEELTEPYGLILNSYGHLVTVDVREGKPFICIFNQDGRLQHNRVLKALDDRDIIARLGIDPKGSKCRFLGIHSDQIHVVDLGLNKIFVCDYDGNFISVFGSGGRGDGQFQDAAGIAFDSAGNCVVADSRNCRLNAFDAKGNSLGVVRTTDSARRPSSIAISRAGDLFVCSIWENCVKKFSF